MCCCLDAGVRVLCRLPRREERKFTSSSASLQAVSRECVVHMTLQAICTLTSLLLCPPPARLTLLRCLLLVRVDSATVVRYTPPGPVHHNLRPILRAAFIKHISGTFGAEYIGKRWWGRVCFLCIVDVTADCFGCSTLRRWSDRYCTYSSAFPQAARRE